jgi:hypothetical protein
MTSVLFFLSHGNLRLEKTSWILVSGLEYMMVGRDGLDIPGTLSARFRRLGGTKEDIRTVPWGDDTLLSIGDVGLATLGNKSR